MIEYRIVEDTWRSTLALNVTEMLKHGWKCQGGVTVGETTMRRTYFQAMIKDDKNGK